MRPEARVRFISKWVFTDNSMKTFLLVHPFPCPTPSNRKLKNFIEFLRQKIITSSVPPLLTLPGGDIIFTTAGIDGWRWPTWETLREVTVLFLICANCYKDCIIFKYSYFILLRPVRRPYLNCTLRQMCKLLQTIGMPCTYLVTE